MKTLFTSALAFAAVGSAVHATEPAPPEESDWARLDREIGELATSLNRRASETNVGGLVRVFYAQSSDKAFELDPSGDDFLVNSGDDLGGFELFDVDVFAEGSVNDQYDWRISFDLAEGDADLEDAFARLNSGQGYELLVGSFKAPVLQSNRVDPENQLFASRTFVGQILDFWDAGAMVAGSWDSLAGFFSIQNGADSRKDDLLISGRAELNLNGGTGRVMGAWGADDDLAATIGGMWMKDESDLSEGDVFGADASVTLGIFSVHGEIVHFDGDILADAGTGVSNIAGGFGGGSDFLGKVMLPLNYAETVGGAFEVDDALMWNGTASVLLENMDLELALRYEVYDDPGNTRSATLGANWYRNGRNAMWQAGLMQVTSNGVQAVSTPVNGKDEGVDDATLFYVGLSVGTTTKNI
jgi:hypothetical protein